MRIDYRDSSAYHYYSLGPSCCLPLCRLFNSASCVFMYSFNIRVASPEIYPLSMPTQSTKIVRIGVFFIPVYHISLVMNDETIGSPEDLTSGQAATVSTARQMCLPSRVTRVTCRHTWPIPETSQPGTTSAAHRFPAHRFPAQRLPAARPGTLGLCRYIRSSENTT